MNRLQKKCFIAATGFHLLLVVILVVGPAFLSSSSKSVDAPVIDFIPVKTVDAAISGGGSPKGGSPPPPDPEPQPPQPTQVVTPPEPQPPEPQPPEPQAAPPPEVKTVKLAKPEPPTPDSSLKPVARKVEVSTKLVKRPGPSAADTAKAEQQARAEEATRRERMAQIGRSMSGIRSGLSGTTSIELKGPGGGGVPYANFLSAVKKIYADAWVVPQGVDDSAATKASITIGRDGRVISSYIITASGDSVVDQSVQAVLNRVRTVVPLPDTTKDEQRTVTIVFDVKAKLLG